MMKCLKGFCLNLVEWVRAVCAGYADEVVRVDCDESRKLILVRKEK